MFPNQNVYSITDNNSDESESESSSSGEPSGEDESQMDFSSQDVSQ